tara:strand:+ start:825 stop:1835 length:1011 start_codon:yes stop_codon:yes gene_type:complete
MTHTQLYTPEIFKPIMRRMIRSFHDGEFTWAGIASDFPDSIMSKIEKAEHDVVIAFNGDPWRYRNDLESFSTGKKVFIIHPGHEHVRYKNGITELSFPDAYFLRQKTEVPFTPLGANLSYGFSCLNNRVAIHRTLLGCKLLEKDLLKSLIYSQGLFDYSEFWETEFPETVPDNYYEFKKMWPYKTIDEKEIYGSGMDGQLIVHPAFHDAYCHIVTETETEEFPYSRNINLPYVSEKSFKPFLSKQIPVLLASRGQMTYLEGLGFQMMRDFLPDNFDNFNTMDKIDAIADIVAMGKEYAKDFYFSHIREIKHNYDLVNIDKVEQIALDSLRDFVKNV